MYDRTDDEVEAGGAEGLAFERSVPDFSALVEEDGALQLMRRLTLVEAGLAAAAQRWARIPFDHEQRSLDPAKFP